MNYKQIFIFKDEIIKSHLLSPLTLDEAHVAQNREQTPANSPHGRVGDPQPNKGPDAANSLQVSMAAGPSPGEPSDAHRPWVSARRIWCL